nr:helix-turn-helix domain-containing protein [Candidatus Sodalis sp. SoCistrobi]
MTRELGISTHKLNVIFSERFGMPAKKWLTQQRLKKGCELLLTTPMPVAEIALRGGFSNHAHFSAIFRRHFKTNPSAFRERARQL